MLKSMFRRIKYFQAVVRHHSFTEAAQQCYVSQSAISQQIRALENELGVSLLHRENHGFTVTPAGQYFYDKSLTLTSDLEMLCKETVEIGNPAKPIFHLT